MIEPASVLLPWRDSGSLPAVDHGGFGDSAPQSAGIGEARYVEGDGGPPAAERSNERAVQDLGPRRRR